MGELSKAGKGRHTTTTATLIDVGVGGRLVDTPGFSQPSLEGVASHQLASLFPEMVQLLEADGPCRFRDCLHVDEPGCTITGRGGRDGQGGEEGSEGGE